jgi:hypothetical protein
LFDLFFDEEYAFLGWSRAIVRRGCWWLIVGFTVKIMAGYGLSLEWGLLYTLHAADPKPGLHRQKNITRKRQFRC